MSLTDREKEIALECAKKMLGFKPSHGTLLVEMMSDFLSHLREEQEVVAWLDDGSTGGYGQPTYRVITNETKSEMPKSTSTVFSSPLFTTPPAPTMINVKAEWNGDGLSSVTSLRVVRTEKEDDGSITAVVREYDDCSCSELVEALKAYDQIVRITISRLIRQYGNDDEYAIELRGCLKNACEALANHAKWMKG